MKRYSFLLIIIFSFLFLYTSAQPGFNKLLDAGYPRNDIWDMLIVNDTIIGYGFGFEDTIDYRQGVILTKFDSNGILLKSTIILDSLGDPLAINKTWGKIIATQDGGFAMTTATVGRNSVLLIKTDHDFDIEFIKEYEDTVNLSNFRYSIRETEGGYLLYGSIQNPDLVLRPFVRRVNMQGDIIWNKYYGNPQFLGVVRDVHKMDDSIITVATSEFTTVDLSGPDQTVIRRIRLVDGTVMQKWESGGNAEMGTVLNFQPIEEGKIIVNAASLVDQIGGTKIVQTAFSRLDADFNIDWTKKVGRSGTFSSERVFWVFRPTLDGNFIAAGQSDVEINGKDEPSGWLMKFSAEGDSIWSRYDFPDFPVDSLGDTFFGGVGVLSSGSIVAGGTATLWNKDAIWLVKVTNDGCLDTIFCGLVPVVEREEEKEDLKIFPNPASQSVTVSLQEASTSPGVIEIYGFDGRLVLQEEYGVGEKEVLVDTSGLPAGLYAVRKMAAGQVVEVGKVIISH